jgi:hypothetical protein
MSRLHWPFSVLDDKIDIITHQLATTGRAIMTTAAQVTALTNAVGALTTAVQDLATKVTSDDQATQVSIAALKAALESAGVNDPAVDKAVADIATASTGIAQAASIAADDAAKLTASLPPAP